MSGNDSVAKSAAYETRQSAEGHQSVAARIARDQVEQLQSAYLDEVAGGSAARASLAKLRRGVGKPLGEIPELVKFVADVETSRDVGDELTPREIGVYTALTLYALHQQSQPYQMHLRGPSMGAALASLRFSDGEENQGVLRRFQALATAISLEEIVHHARGLVVLLRSARRGLDYGRLADDLVRLQDPSRADAVRLAWGRAFYRTPRDTSETTESDGLSAHQTLSPAQDLQE